MLRDYVFSILKAPVVRHVCHIYYSMLSQCDNIKNGTRNNMVVVLKLLRCSHCEQYIVRVEGLDVFHSQKLLVTRCDDR